MCLINVNLYDSSLDSKTAILSPPSGTSIIDILTKSKPCSSFLVRLTDLPTYEIPIVSFIVLLTSSTLTSSFEGSYKPVLDIL